MKTKIPFLITIFSLLIISCATKNNPASEKIYGTNWELEYISGPRIAFNGLYPNRKPKIMFNKETKKVSGNNSCNGYTADFIVKGNSITFGETGPTTMMYCGEGEQVFLKMIKKINHYSLDSEGKLNLLMDEVPVMRFKKVESNE